VLLIAHATARCNGVKRFARGQHHGLCYLNAPAIHEVAWGYAERTLECAAKVAGAQAQEFREFPHANSSG
jgi:hypothetical protein